jgi:hypothetical protein
VILECRDLSPLFIKRRELPPCVCTGKKAAINRRTPKEKSAMQFDHIGLITAEKKLGERFVPATKVWVTDMVSHPFHIEWLRFEPDSPVTGPVRDMPHVAYRVESIRAAAEGLKVLLEPFDAGIASVGFYQTADGAVVEFMQYPKESK